MMTAEDSTIQTGMMTVIGILGFDDLGAGVDTGVGSGLSAPCSALGFTSRY